MKIGIVSWTYWTNYGTELQLYALQNILKNMHHKVRIISDDSIIIKIRNIKPTPKSNKNLKYQIKCKIKNLIKKDISLPYCKIDKNIKNFKKSKLNIIPYKPELLNDSLDIFICGSDQIWSLKECDFDSFYWLGFTSKKKISYAPSMGTMNITRQNEIKMLLKDFDHISVRERQNSYQLSELTNKKVQWVCDPTLLFTKDYWNRVSGGKKKFIQKKYILCYFLESNNWYFEYANEVSKQFEIELLLICNLREHCYSPFACQKAPDPLEFVNMIKNAEFILTDSYHGSIFSLIFNKKFLYLKRFEDTDSDKSGQNVRIYSLFEYLNIQNIIVSRKAFNANDIKQIDYNFVNEKISKFRESSLNLLTESINN